MMYNIRKRVDGILIQYVVNVVVVLLLVNNWAVEESNYSKV